MRIVNWNELAEDQRRQLLTRPAMTGAADITSTVSDIINRIRREGDKALKEYTAAFDRVADGNILLSQEAIAAAVRAGADEATVEIIDSEDVPLAYYPGKTSRIRIKAAGDLRMAQTEK